MSVPTRPDVDERPIRVLYSFPHKIGAARICYTAWQQVSGLAAAGAEVTVFTGAVRKALPENVRIHSTLAPGGVSLPYRLLGQVRALTFHDAVVARRIQSLKGAIDVIHTWPLGALKTLRAAKELRIPTVLERPNAHTGFAYRVVREECERLGVELPPDHEHAYNPALLRHEEEEYRLTDYLLCPSDFVLRTFLDEGFAPEKLLRHIYGYDECVFSPDSFPGEQGRGLTMLFVGVAAVRKGVHYALEAWLSSPASRDGRFLIAGEFLPAYAKRLSSMLEHPSVHVLGHRDDVPDLMRRSDILVLPSIEEGFGLVCAEAIGSGCVPLVSDACTDVCVHMVNALVHPVGDVDTLRQHITMVHEDRAFLTSLRSAGLSTAPDITWTAAGAKLLGLYEQVVRRASANDRGSLLNDAVG